MTFYLGVFYWSNCKKTLNKQGLKLGPQEWVCAVVLEFSSGLCRPQRATAELYCKRAVTARTTKIELKTYGNSPGSPTKVSCFSWFDWSYHKGDTDDWKVTFWTANTSRRCDQKGFEKSLQDQESPFIFFACVSLRRFSPFSSHLSILSFYWTFLENFPLFCYELMKCLIKNKGNVSPILFYLAS